MALQRLFSSLLPAMMAVLFATALAGATPAVAAEQSQAKASFVPTPPKGKGDKCVADTDFMRRNHMNLLKHQRDDTVHDGIRTKQFSLKECVACHAVNGPDAQPVTVESPQHFCRVCHDYAAVSIDCFQCHASRPEAGKAAQSSTGAREREALASYLEGARQ